MLSLIEASVKPVQTRRSTGEIRSPSE